MSKSVILLGALSTLGVAASAAQLSEVQKAQLEKITQGDVSKRDVELVLAHFNENVSWSDPYASIRTIYCKGSQVPGCVALGNIGREGHTYLHHIITNYDNLADWTVFSQAGPPAVGYNGHRLGGGHLQSGVEFHDYLLRDQDRDSFFVFTGAVHLPSLFHVIRSSYLFPPASSEEQLAARAQCPSQTAFDRWERLDLPKWFRNMMASLCGFQDGGLQARLQQYWEDHINPDMPKDGMVFFAQGARFAVSKERIHQRSREEYMDLLNLVSGAADPCENYLNEWLWYYIMGKPQQAPCAGGDVDVEAPVSAAVRFLSGMSGSEPTPTAPPTATPTPTPVYTGSLKLQVSQADADLLIEHFQSGTAAVMEAIAEPIADVIEVDTADVTITNIDVAARRLLERQLTSSVELTVSYTVRVDEAGYEAFVAELESANGFNSTALLGSMNELLAAAGVDIVIQGVAVEIQGASPPTPPTPSPPTPAPAPSGGGGSGGDGTTKKPASPPSDKATHRAAGSWGALALGAALAVRGM